MKIFNSLFLVLMTTSILFSCSIEEGRFIENEKLELKKDAFISSKSNILHKIDVESVSIFKNSLEFGEKGNLRTFQYDILKEKLNATDFKNLLVEFYRNENVDKIFFVNSNGEQEVIFESTDSNSSKNDHHEPMNEDVYLFQDKKNYHGGGCRPRNGWICEIRVNSGDTILV